MLAILLLAILGSNAQAIEYDCGKSMNFPQSLEITPQDDDEFPLSAVLILTGADQTSGMLSPRIYNLKGDSEISTDDNGKDQPIYSFVVADRPNTVFFLAKGNRIGASYNGLLTNLENLHKTEVRCRLTKR